MIYRLPSAICGWTVPAQRDLCQLCSELQKPRQMQRKAVIIHEFEQEEQQTYVYILYGFHRYVNGA
jgi:hypothetical protein